MGNVTVVGAQWGDEGKGKIVDWLASRADVVVRFQGGHNAGHTLVVGNQTYKLSLLPSGIVRGTLSVIGNGVVLDPWALKAEVERIGEQGVTVKPEVLMIAETCPLILPIHRDLDALREDASGAGKIGTTRRGIGPAYEDKVGRRAIRLMDLADLEALPDKIERLLAHITPCGGASASRKSSRASSTRNSPASPPRCCPTWTPSGGSSTSNGAPGGASCSRARRGRSSTSTTAPIPS